MADSYLYRTQGTPTGAGKKATASAWVKYCRWSLAAGGTGGIFEVRNASTTSTWDIYVDGNNIVFGILDSSSWVGSLAGTPKLRDNTAWYHIVAIWDSTESTDTDRMQIWINGVKETVFNSTTYPSENHTNTALAATSGYQQQWGAYGYGGTSKWNGYMAQCVFVDGLALPATTFGSFDATTGEWKPKSDGEVRSGVTFGDQGCLINFSNGSNLGYDYQTSDRSGTTNDFTVSGDGMQSQDNPSNNFPTISPNYMPFDDPIFYPDIGNLYCQSQTSASTYFGGAATMGLSKGKWYWETKGYTGWNGGAIGVFSDPQNSADNDRTCGYNAHDWAYRSDGQVESNNTTQDSGMGTYADGDVIGTYLDLDNNKIYWAKNGTIINSGTGWTITAAASTTHGFYFPGQADIAGSGGSYFGLNYGNGWFKDAALTGTTYNDAQGQGIFKYSPNDGGASSFDSSAKDFLAICTKNLKTYGG